MPEVIAAGTGGMTIGGTGVDDRRGVVDGVQAHEQVGGAAREGEAIDLGGEPQDQRSEGSEQERAKLRGGGRKLDGWLVVGQL